MTGRTRGWELVVYVEKLNAMAESRPRKLGNGDKRGNSKRKHDPQLMRQWLKEGTPTYG